MTSFATLPEFLSHFLLGLALLAAAVAGYVRLTPHDELALVRAGNTAAAVSLGGAVLGFGLAVGAAIHASTNLLDAVVWGAVALLVQVAAFLAVCWLLPGWRAGLERGEMAGAVLAASVAVAVGLVNAGSLAF